MRSSPLDMRTVPAAVNALRPAEAAGREIADVVAAILADVRARGDEAVVEWTARFDYAGATVADLAVPAA